LRSMLSSVRMVSLWSPSLRLFLFIPVR
jgi:hypothetical protein